MIITYDDLKTIINLGPGAWSLIECQDISTEAGVVAHVITFVFSGMGKSIGYPSSELRDEQFGQIKAKLLNLNAEKSNVVMVKPRLVPSLIS